MSTAGRLQSAIHDALWGYDMGDGTVTRGAISDDGYHLFTPADRSGIDDLVFDAVWPFVVGAPPAPKRIVGRKIVPPPNPPVNLALLREVIARGAFEELGLDPIKAPRFADVCIQEYCAQTLPPTDPPT